ncbi:MAG: hydrolase [Pseudomonadales bacterium]|nr:hydrolase [Pseudomonadales bacterium]
MSAKESLQWIDARQPTLIATLKELSAINSGTGNLDGLASMETAFSELFTPIADSVEVIPSEKAEHADLEGNVQTTQYGNMLKFSKRAEAPIQVLLVGHMDTVFPIDHPFQSPTQIDDNVLKGPGVADMKGGILVMHTALSAFENASNNDQLGWQVLLNADEETGSHGSKDALVAAAETATAGMIYEPALADGTLSRARKGSGNFTLIAHGRSAHAGREFEKGKNAILALGQAMTQLAALTDLARGLTVNIARVNGGTAFNVVPDTAVCQFNIRCVRSEDQVEVKQQIDDLLQQWNRNGDARFELHGKFTRPPKEVSPAHQLMMDWLQDCGAQLGVDVAFQDTGGCCDGNNLAAAGLPNIDTLGVLGGHIHTDQEFMLMDSLAQRAKLSLGLLQRLAAEGEHLIALRESASC